MCIYIYIYIYTHTYTYIHILYCIVLCCIVLFTCTHMSITVRGHISVYSLELGGP